jgi:SAM-dependent methyltransferase
MDLHQGFREPARAPAQELARFLSEVDRLPGIRAIRAAMREAVALRSGMRLLDAGCGSGIETARLAQANPRALVTGLDRNVELLRDAPRGPTWIEGDLLEPGLPARSFDVVRTERVLMYVPDLHRALDALTRLLVPGGRLVLFELDYGATILAPSRLGNRVVGRAGALLDGSLPQPRAGRELPRLLAERGARDIDARPFTFAVNEPVWRRIVYATLAPLADPDLLAYLDEVPRAPLLAAFTGVLTVASVV